MLALVNDLLQFVADKYDSEEKLTLFGGSIPVWLTIRADYGKNNFKVALHVCNVPKTLRQIHTW